METLRQPKSRERGARLSITAATLLIVLPLCAWIESVSSRAKGADDAPSTALLAESQREPEQKDIRAAHQALQEAYVTALGSKLWEGMFEVGDGYLRIGEAVKARRCYLIALYRARREGSADGALRVAEALAVMGDREMAAQALVIGQRLADGTSDPRLPGLSAAEFLKVNN